MVFTTQVIGENTSLERKIEILEKKLEHIERKMYKDGKKQITNAELKPSLCSEYVHIP